MPLSFLTLVQPVIHPYIAVSCRVVAGLEGPAGVYSDERFPCASTCGSVKGAPLLGCSVVSQQ